MHKEYLRYVPENQDKSDKQILSKGLMVVPCISLTVCAMEILQHVTHGSHERGKSDCVLPLPRNLGRHFFRTLFHSVRNQLESNMKMLIISQHGLQKVWEVRAYHWT